MLYGVCVCVCVVGCGVAAAAAAAAAATVAATVASPDGTEIWWAFCRVGARQCNGKFGQLGRWALVMCCHNWS